MPLGPGLPTEGESTIFSGMRRTIILLAICTSSVLACTRGAPQQDPTVASVAAVAPAANQPSAASPKVGDKAKCLVSGEEFVIADSSPKAEYEGKTYYFCCPSCADSFKADPKKYLK